MAVSNSNNPNVVLSAGRGSDLRSRSKEAVLHFPAAPEKLGMGMLFKFTKFSYDFNMATTGQKNKIATDITQAHIALPLPENLVDSIGINYETTDLGMAAIGAAAGSRTANALKSFLSGQDQAAEGSDTGGPTVGGTSEYVLRSLAQASGSVSGLLNLGAGNVPNPFQTALFKNVEIRQHNFTFRLVPETPEDSLMISKIISQFKYRALPGKTTDSTFLTMPDEVDIIFFGTNALYGFARCVIRRVQVNYAPQNVPAFFKNSPDGKLVGAPQAVELQLELSEIEQLTRESYSDGAGGDLDGPSSPEGNESIPNAERPGNKLRSGTANPVARFDGNSRSTPLVIRTPQPIQVQLPEGTRYFPDQAAYDAYKARPSSVVTQNVGGKVYYTLPNQTTEGTIAPRDFQVQLPGGTRYFKSQAAYNAWQSNPASVTQTNVGGKVYLVLPGES